MANQGRDKLPAADDGRGGVLPAGCRRWEDLSVDLLVDIFSRIGVEDLIAGVPHVCSSWWYAALEPTCWRNVDFRSWDVISRRLGCQRDDRTDFGDLFEFVLSRSEDDIEYFHFPDFADEIDLEYLATRCPELHYFSLTNSDLSEDQFCISIGKLKHLTGMSVDDILISHEVLQHVSQCCDNFIELRVFSKAMNKETASIICECLPRLQKLEITDCNISVNAIVAFLDGLKELEFLDISGYPLYGVTSEVIEKASRLKVFRWDSSDDAVGHIEYFCVHLEEDIFAQTPCHCWLDYMMQDPKYRGNSP